MAAAVSYETTLWSQESARALKTKDNAKTYARRTYSPIQDEYARSRIYRNKMTYENRMRSRVYVGALSNKYRAIKNSYIGGSLGKSAFNRAYSMTASHLS